MIKLAIMADYVVQRVPDEQACTCASPGGEFGHEAHCGWEPVIPVALLAALGFTPPSDDRSQVSDGWHTFAELYAHRRALTAALTRCLGPRAWRSRLHHDGTMLPGMFIVGADLRSVGQVSYHYDLEHWDDFAHVAERPRAPEFDGHTPDDVVERLLLWAGKATTR